MKFFYIFLLSIAFLFASNPLVYSALGDKVYNNAKKIEKLKNIKQYYMYYEKIDKYLSDINQTKQLGFDIEKGVSKSNKEYLKKLRELSSINDFFIRSAEHTLDISIESKDFELFTKIINTGLIDLKRYKQKILIFYKENKSYIRPDGLLGEFIKSNTPKNKQKYDKAYYERLKKLREEELIRRLRKKDRLKQQELQQKLEKALKIKKENIRKKQLMELQYNGVD